MLLKYTCMTDVDLPALMAIYAEGNEENGAYFFPDLPRQEQLRRAEAEFARFLREEFFTGRDRVMYVLEAEGVWAAALRLERTGDCFWLEALETRPDLRRRGHALALLRAVQQDLSPCVIRDAVSRRNTPSLRTHLAAGFLVENDPAVSYPTGEIDPRCLGMCFSG